MKEKYSAEPSLKQTFKNDIEPNQWNAKRNQNKKGGRNLLCSTKLHRSRVPLP